MPTQLTTGDLVTAANWNTIPGGVIGYAQTTTNVGSIVGSNVILATTTADFPANRRIKMTASWHSWSTTVALDRIRFELVSTSIRMQQFRKNRDAGVASEGGTMVVSFDSGATPTSAAGCTFRAARESGTGTLTVIGLTTAPISILIEDCGPI